MSVRLVPHPPDPCPFCERILLHNYDGRRLIGGEDIVVFEPLKPVTPGHQLVVPIRHVVDATADPLLAGKVMAVAAMVASPILAVNFITSAGRDATQTVPHLHVHVLPRRPGDGLSLPWDVRS